MKNEGFLQLTMLQITEKAREMLDKFAEQAEEDDVALKIVILEEDPRASSMTCS